MTLHRIPTDNANLMGMTISNKRVFIFLCGVFGWTGTPAAFQVVTRALMFKMNISYEAAYSCTSMTSWESVCEKI